MPRPKAPGKTDSQVDFEIADEADVRTQRKSKRKQRGVLTPGDVRLIKVQLILGISKYLLAKRYGVTVDNISAIQQGKIWTDI